MESSGYCEVLVKVQPLKWERIMLRVISVLGVIYLALGLIYIIFLLLAVIFLVVAAIWKRRQCVEYEYQYLDGSLRIDRIIAMKKRKKVGRYELDNLQVMAPEGDDRLQGYLSRSDVKQLDYSSRDEAAPNRYVMVFQGQYIILEPSEAMVQMIWRAAPSKVVRKRQVIS